jgi:serine/threonine-protein kinase HipA
LIGNTDAHGKNLSYFIDKSGLRLAPSYDMVACEMPECVDHEIGMAIGDEFLFKNVGAFDWAEMAFSCGINKRSMKREMQRMGKSVLNALDHVHIDFVDKEEEEYISALKAFVRDRIHKLTDDAKMVADAIDDILRDKENSSF